MNNLLTPANIGNYQLKNRVVMGPLTRNRAQNPQKMTTELHAEYYAQRAGAGLIISEATNIEPRGVGFIHAPGIYTPDQIRGWQKVTAGVHEKGGIIFNQLYHAGSYSHPELTNGLWPVSASAINPHGRVHTETGAEPTFTPQALHISEIRNLIHQYVQASENALEAEFDGVEIHGAFGYLIAQFLSPETNIRKDIYGGSIENRSRFLLEIVEKVIEKVGSDKVGVRLSPRGTGKSHPFEDPERLKDFEYIVDALNQYDLAYLHMVEPFSKKGGPFIRITPHFRKIYRGTLITNGGYDQQTGNEAISSQEADLVSFGNLFISNPDLPKRFELDAPLNEADPATIYSGGAKGYIDYPTLEESSLEFKTYQKSA